jgi:hypothetical protein
VKVKHLRPGDWVVTSWQEGGNPRLRLRGLLVGIVRRPGDNAGPLAYVLSNYSGVHCIKASNILERRPAEGTP